MAVRGVVIGLAVGMALLAAPAGAEEGAAGEGDPPLSPAQIALFATEHLKAITRPVALDYAFEHRGGKSGAFSDKIVEEIRTVHDDGKKDVWIEFLTGERKVDFPPAMGFVGNPLLMYVLEYDVREMNEATGGAQLYFRNRMRNAFMTDSETRPITFPFGGGTETGTEVIVTPFRRDPNLAKFPAFAEKTYRFVLSPAVPGGIYRISTSVPDAGGDAATFEDVMTYQGERPLGG
jgi:hypothetical protein